MSVKLPAGSNLQHPIGMLFLKGCNAERPDTEPQGLAGVAREISSGGPTPKLANTLLSLAAGHVPITTTCYKRAQGRLASAISTREKRGHQG